MNFLRGLGLADKHLSRGNKAGDQFEFCVVQMKGFFVNVAVHVRVGQEHLGRAALGNDLQHLRFLELLDRLRGQDHGGIVLAPGFLCLHDVLPDRLIADEEPCFIHQEDFEGAKLARIGDFVAGPVQNVKQQRLQDIGCIAPALKVECFKSAEGKRVLDVVEDESRIGRPWSSGAAAPSTRR